MLAAWGQTDFGKFNEWEEKTNMEHFELFDTVWLLVLLV